MRDMKEEIVDAMEDVMRDEKRLCEERFKIR